MSLRPECISLTFEEERTFFTFPQLFSFVFNLLSGGLAFCKSHSVDKFSQCIIPGKALLLDCWYDAGHILSPGDSGCLLG